MYTVNMVDGFNLDIVFMFAGSYFTVFSCKRLASLILDPIMVARRIFWRTANTPTSVEAAHVSGSWTFIVCGAVAVSGLTGATGVVC